MSKTKYGLLALGFLSLLSPRALAQGGSCGRILFDCDSHVVTVGNLKGTLDCGRSTPGGYTGRIGAKGVAVGTYFPCLRGKPTVNVGLGQVIVHAPCGGRKPKGQNQTFGHSGCLNVSAEMLGAIGRCQRASYHIKFDGSVRSGAGGRKGRLAARRYYRNRSRYAFVNRKTSNTR